MLVIAAMSNLDPVTLTVIQNGLIQVCNEMDLAFVRSAFSPVISEGMDRSDGIYDASDGSLIAQGELGLPVFVGTMQFSSRAVIDRVKSHYAGKVDPGDVFIVNDPYLGGTHLMDVRFVKPFFYKGELFAWLANTGHWPDVGGMVPGGFSASATEVEQEGLRLPPVKFWKKGEMDQEILSIILSNIRIADQRIGDIKAQAAALTTGEVRLTALIDRYGAEVVRQAIAEMRHRAERQMRAKIADIPDGVYEGTSQVDSDGVVDQPLTIKMKITKKGEDLLFDMTGSSPPCRGPMNSVIATTKSAIYLAVKHIFPDVPINAGTFEPLKIVEPEGTFLYAKYPRPVSGCAAEVSQRIAEAVFAALTKAIPDLLFAAPAGTSGNLGVGGYDPERDRSYIMYLFTGGGYGGFQGGDGLSNGCSTIGISKMPPVEVLEQFYPVLFEEFSLREGSGGAGEFRGGFGINYAIKLRRGEARVSMVMDHGRTGPQGVLGGAAGGVNTVAVSQGGKTYKPPHLSKDQDIEIGVGDVVRVSTPGGGGFGDPAKRKPEAIARDVARGYYSEAEAREKFGHTSSGPRVSGLLRDCASQRLAGPRRAHQTCVLASAVGCGGAPAAQAQLKQPPPPSQAPQSVWYAVRGPDNAFIVDMPGEPVYKLIDTVSPGGTKFVYHSYSLDYRRLSFVAQTALYPADVDVSQPKLNLQSVLDDRAQRLVGGKWTKIEWREVLGAPAAELIGSVAGGSVLRQLVLLKGRRYVSLACLGPADSLRTPEVERFFKSLRLGV